MKYLILQTLLLLAAFHCEAQWGMPHQLEPQEVEHALSKLPDEGRTALYCVVAAQAAMNGDVEAQYNLGDNMLKLRDADHIKAIQWLRHAANQGHIKAQLRLFQCYSSGEGVAVDKTEASKWLRMAAEQGVAIAQFGLGILYRDGEGVDIDKSEAVRWFREAAGQGFAEGQFALGRCYMDGVGISRDKREAVRWIRKAAEQGLVRAQFCLGVCYRDGDCVASDKDEALRWFRKAEAQGSGDATNAINEMNRNPTFNRKDTESQDSNTQRVPNVWCFLLVVVLLGIVILLHKSESTSNSND